MKAIFGLIITFFSITTVMANNITQEKTEHKKEAPLTKAQKTKILINKASPSKIVKRTSDPYKYLRSRLEKKPLYYRQRYRKMGRSQKLYSNIQETRAEQKFYEKYTPAKHLQKKIYYPSQKFVHYQELYRFGQRAEQLKAHKYNKSSNRSQ